MGVLDKAKLAAKRTALKGRTRGLSLETLQGLKPLKQKSIFNQRPPMLSNQNGEQIHGQPSPDSLPRVAPGVRILPVKAKVVGSQALTDAINERRALRLARKRALSHASKLNQSDYGSIQRLRKLLGLPPLYTSHCVANTSALPEDALIVSFDTEWEFHGFRSHVVEIGVTVLDTREIVDTAPGSFAEDWISKTKTHHYVVDVTRRPTDRMRSCYFSDDMFGDVASVRSHLLSVLQQYAHPSYDPKGKLGRGPRKIVLVGHSVSIDINQLYRSPGLELDLFSQEVFLTKPAMAFDTLMLTDTAIQQGAAMKSAKLGRLASWLGIHHQYQQDGSSIGCHNAGNDAAYTMMALLIYAVRWENIVPGEIVPLSSEELDNTRALRSAANERKRNESFSFGDMVMDKARSVWKAV